MSVFNKIFSLSILITISYNAIAFSKPTSDNPKTLYKRHIELQNNNIYFDNEIERVKQYSKKIVKREEKSAMDRYAEVVGMTAEKFAKLYYKIIKSVLTGDVSYKSAQPFVSMCRKKFSSFTKDIDR